MLAAMLCPPGLAAQMTGDSLPSPDSSAQAAGPVTVTGRVINAMTNLPISRALVRFNGRAMLTGREGKFEFDQVTESTGFFQVIKPGFYSSIDPGGSATTSWRAGQEASIELHLYPEAIFTGTVTAPDGDPLPHVVVSARRRVYDDSGRGWIPVGQGQTDSHGRFRVAVPPGDYRLETMTVSNRNTNRQMILPVRIPAETSSVTSASDSVRIRSGEELRFDLHPAVSTAYTVTATFDSSLGRGFPRITARTANGLRLPLPVKETSSDTSNVATMELPSGTYTLTASVLSPEGSEQAQTSVTVTDHDLSGVVFHLAPVPVLPVELQVGEASTSDNAQPNLQQLGLTLENTETDAEPMNSTIRLSTRRDRTVAFTVPPGSYRLRGRSSGSWYITSASYGATDLLQQDLTVGPGVGGTPIRVTVSDQTASLEGVCRLGGVPSDCWVYLIPSTPSAETVFILHGNNAEGSYRYAHLPPGSYQAVAFAERYTADYSDPATLTPFATRVRAITIHAGEKPTLDLDVVPASEMTR
jgi:hypothetical protein